ncbi:zinc transporter ZIP3 [Anolis carolinensis]|uniref:zinc transporter ZIP3 n=1 Tax=Anolis carolinensis TaxID=28377 RepID=UPI002F2B610E
MRVLLAKLLCMAGVFLLTLAASLLPVKLLRAHSAGKAPGGGGGGSRRALSLCNAFATGVLLATGFNALLPAVRDKMSEVLRLGQVRTDYLLPETLMLTGFFLTVFVEQLVLTFREDRRPPFIDLETFNAGGSGGSGSSASEDESPFLDGHPGGHGGPGAHRLLGPSLALGAHGALEGLALGLAEGPGGRLLGLFLGVALHEGLAALALGLSLARAGRPLRQAARLALPLSLALPLGLGAGAALQGCAPPPSAPGGLAAAVASLLPQGLAAGTFLFATFCEILGKELEQGPDRLLKVLLLVLGYALLAALAFLKG